MHSCSIHNAYKCNLLNQKDISPQNALTSGICEESSLEENGYERNHFVGRAAEQNAARQKHLSFRMSDTKCFVSLSPPLSSLHLDQQDREIFFFSKWKDTLSWDTCLPVGWTRMGLCESPGARTGHLSHLDLVPPVPSSLRGFTHINMDAHPLRPVTGPSFYCSRGIFYLHGETTFRKTLHLI